MNCSVLMREVKNKKQMFKPRCIACRKLRRTLQNRRNRQKDLKERYARSRRKVDLSRRKIQRLRQRVHNAFILI